MFRSSSFRTATGVALATALFLVAAAPTAHADRYNRKVEGHPLRYVAYILHPVGIALEYAIARPIHWVVSQPNLDIIFGHQPTVMEDGTYFEWVHGDYKPSIADKRTAMTNEFTSTATGDL